VGFYPFRGPDAPRALAFLIPCADWSSKLTIRIQCFVGGPAIFIPLTLTCKAVLFDMDGTLVDSTSVVERAWAWWAKRQGIPLEAVLSFSHGRPTIATMDHFLPGHDHAEELDEMARYEETELEGILAVPGAIQIVCALQKHPWAIVTSAWRTLAEARVAAAGLPVPKVIVPVDEIRNGKPDPEGFLCAAERLGVPPEECLVFEDTRPLIRDFRDVAIRPQGDHLKVDLRDASNLD
jgi:sugar-phosphatase